MPVEVNENLFGIADALRLLSKRRVLVGIPQANDARDDGSTFGNAARAYVFENGAPEINMPARPSLVPGVEAALPAITVALEHAAKAALLGDVQRMDANLEIAGTKANNSVMLLIQSNIPPPLAQSTINARRRRSKGSSYRRKATTTDDVTALIDTGEWWKSHTYVVEKS